MNHTMIGSLLLLLAGVTNAMVNSDALKTVTTPEQVDTTFCELRSKYNKRGWLTPVTLTWQLEDSEPNKGDVTPNSPAALNPVMNIMHIHASVLYWDQEEIKYVVGHEMGHSVKNQLFPRWVEPTLSVALHAGGSLWLNELFQKKQIALSRTSFMKRMHYTVKQLLALHVTMGGYLWVDELPIQKAREIEADMRAMMISPQTAPEGIIKNCKRMKTLNEPYHLQSKTHPELGTRMWYAKEFIRLRDNKGLPSWIDRI